MTRRSTAAPETAAGTVSPIPNPAARATGCEDWYSTDEPGDDDEADRDPPHPSDPMYDQPSRQAAASGDAPTTEPAEQAGRAMDAAAHQELRRKLAAIRHNAYTTGIGANANGNTGPTARGNGRWRPASTTLYVHITDQTLLDGSGVARVEHFGLALAARLEELLGHSQIIIKPVIDLNDKISVNAYEIPRRIRERVKLTHPIEQFPYGASETTNSTDLDHIKPYNHDPTAPPDQTSTTKLAPLRRYSHRVKTHGDWAVERLDNGSLKWTTRHGFKLIVDHTGTHPIHPDTEEEQ